MPKKKKAYFDGSCKNNPGKIGSWGFVICDPWIEKKEIIRGENITNNLAEYVALKKLIIELKRLDLQSINIYGDSKLICNTVNKEWGWKKNQWKPHQNYPRLSDLAKSCNRYLMDGNHNLQWIPRSENTIADELSKQAYLV